MSSPEKRPDEIVALETIAELTSKKSSMVYGSHEMQDIQERFKMTRVIEEVGQLATNNFFQMKIEQDQQLKTAEA